MKLYRKMTIQMLNEREIIYVIIDVVQMSRQLEQNSSLHCAVIRYLQSMKKDRNNVVKGDES